VDIIHAIILGVIQGLTEFLPVSSSGHLAVTQILMGFGKSELVLDVCLHTGTLIAILIVFRNDIIDILKSVTRLPQTLEQLKHREKVTGSIWLVVLIICGSIITIIIGLFGERLFIDLFSSIRAVGICFLITGSILWMTKYVNRPVGRTIENMRIRDALTIGFVQGLAIAPGISRSGTTISTALLLGLDRELAARYSFLLFIPAVAGATLLELRHWETSSFSAIAIVSGTISAFLVGYAALKILLNIIERGTFHYFSYYCWVLGASVLIYSFFFQPSLPLK